MLYSEFSRNTLLFFDMNIFIETWFTVREENGNQQPDQHANDRNDHCRWNLIISNFKTIRLTKGIDVMTQNIIQEDRAKTDWNEHIGGNQTKGQQTGHQTAIQL